MYGILLDSPSKPSKPIQIAALGDFEDSRYGSFSITRDDVADWQKNLSKLPGGQALIDFEHRSERKPRDSKAAGWVTGISLDGDRVMARVRWTPRGEKAIKRGEYQFISPAYGEHTNERGETFENTLVSVALTNKPALTGMPAVVLASPERLDAANGKPKAKKAKPKPTKLDAARTRVDTLEAEVTSARKLAAQAEAARDRALRRLDQEAFDRAFGEALKARKVAPGEREILERMYQLDSGDVLALFEARQPIMPDKPEHEPAIEFSRDEVEHGEFDADAAARSGLHPESVQLDAQVRSRLRKLGKPLSEYGNVAAEILGGNNG